MQIYTNLGLMKIDFIIIHIHLLFNIIFLFIKNINNNNKGVLIAV